VETPSAFQWAENPKIAHLWGDLDPNQIHDSTGPWTPHPNNVSTGSAVEAGFTVVTNRQTKDLTPSVVISGI